MKRLQEVAIQQEAVVLDIAHVPLMKRRLMDLGFVRGTRVIPILESPSKDMRAYLVKGCKIALRSVDANAILVEQKGGGPCCLKK